MLNRYFKRLETGKTCNLWYEFLVRGCSVAIKLEIKSALYWAAFIFLNSALMLESDFFLTWFLKSDQYHVPDGCTASTS